MPDIVQKILNIWNQTEIPTIDKTYSVRLLKFFFDKYKTLIRSFSSTRKSKDFDNKIDQFKQYGVQLFDLASCRCEKNCDCESKKRVPEKF